jgi:hypothetical protein
VYRELDRQALNNSKDRGSRTTEKARKKRKSTELDPATLPNVTSGESSKQTNRQLVGSLIASYAFKDSGLIKKTMSLTVNRWDPDTHQPVIETIHLVSYYCADDVLSGKLTRPSEAPDLKDLPLSPEIWAAIKESSLGGKVPIDDGAYYLMDQSNPNAADLGFNPQLHMQYQQPAPLQQPIQQQMTQHVSQQHMSHQPGFQIPFGPYSQPYVPHGMSFSLPPPVSHSHTQSGGSSSGDYVNDLNLPVYGQRLSDTQQYVGYPPPMQQQQQQQQQQLPSSPNSPSKREFVPPTTSNYNMAQSLSSSHSQAALPRQGDHFQGPSHTIPASGQAPVQSIPKWYYDDNGSYVGSYPAYQQPH